MALLAAALAAGPAISAFACDLSGDWRSTLGTLHLQQPAGTTELSGSVETQDGLGYLSGQIASGSVELTWALPATYAPPRHAGTGSLVIAGNCDQLEGQLQSAGGEAQTLVARRVTQGAYDDEAPRLAAVAGQAVQLDALAQLLDKAADLLSDSAYDPERLVRSVGGDPQLLRDWVAENIALVPYRGILKGAAGTWHERAGNSLDRALLLAELLRAAGHQARLARTELDAGSLAQLLNEASRRTAIERSEGGLATGDFAGLVDGSAVLDQALFARTAAELEAERQRLSRYRAHEVARQSDALAALLGPRTADADDGASLLADHWWVQVQSSGTWVELDPTVLTGHPAAAETWAPEELPEALYHRVSLVVSLEIRREGTTTEEPLLSLTLRTAEMGSQPINFLHYPLTIGWPGLVDALGGDAPFSEKLAQEWSWAPIVEVGDELFTGKRFDLGGGIHPFDPEELDPSLADGFRRTLDQPMGTITDILGTIGSDEPPAAEPQGLVTAEFLTFTFEVPGRESIRERRTIFDLVGPVARTAGSETVLDAGAEALRARALGGVATLWLSGATVGLAELSRVTAAQASHQLQIAAQLLQAGATERAIEPPALGGEPPIYGIFDIARRDAAVSPRLYRDRSNLLVVWSLPPPAGAAVATDGTLLVDVVANGMGVLPAALNDAFALRLRQGVADTVAEALLIDGHGPVENTAVAFGAALDAGTAWTLIDRPDGAAVRALQLAPDAEATLLATLAEGYLVVAPQGGTVWWRIDPTSGETLGMAATGAGQAMTEKAELESKAWWSKVWAWSDFGLRWVGFGICIDKTRKAKATVAGAVGSLACLLGSLAGIFAQGMKLAGALGANAVDGTKVIGTAVGVAGYFLGFCWLCVASCRGREILGAARKAPAQKMPSMARSEARSAGAAVPAIPAPRR